MKKKLIVLIGLMFTLQGYAQQSPIGHDVYDKWEVIESVRISPDGNTVAWLEVPGKGDNKLIIFRKLRNRYDTIKYVSEPAFSPDGSFLYFKINLPYDTLRKSRLEKKREVKHYELGVYLLEKDTLIRFQKIVKHAVAADDGGFIAMKFEKEKKKASKKAADTLNKPVEKEEKWEPKTDATLSDEPEAKDSESKGGKLLFYSPSGFNSISIDDADEFVISAKGEFALALSSKADSLDSVRAILVDLKKQEQRTLFHLNGFARKPCLDESGHQAACLYSTDTLRNKTYSIVYQNIKDKNPYTVSELSQTGKSISEHASLYFSRNGKSLFYGIADAPQAEIKDSIPDNEKSRLDVWNYLDDRLQTRQLKQLDTDRKKSHLCRFDIGNRKVFYQTDDTLISIQMQEFGDEEFFKAINSEKYQRENSRLGNSLYDLYRVSATGEKQLLAIGLTSHSYVLPDGKNAIWYNQNDSSWHRYNPAKKQLTNLTSGIGERFYDKEHDVPSPPSSYGIAGWSSDYRFVYIYSEFDIWQFDLSDKTPALNLTKSAVTAKGVRFRHQNLSPKNRHINLKERLIFSAFNTITKESGYYSFQNGRLEKLLMENERISGIVKASNSDDIVFRRSSFLKYPDIWYCQLSFSNPVRISAAGSQVDCYLWGSVETLNWTTYSGKTNDGLLYLPSGFDSKKKYPMLVYFYEKSSDNLHSFYHQTPSRSVINPAFYTSNGYIVFVPDISYSIGQPGADAWDAIMSGVDFLSDRPYIDTLRMGLQGQSWGGYQVAWLVTRTSRFKAAMAGAPVANMTSAYGGIRWESGINRAFQYERGQSRIGQSLWENMEAYIENSPLFFADKITTPLLMMSNDNDGAVPWYQGIELFSALYRLDKAVWMLNYNGDGHNLMKYPNRIDLSIRMFQFFEHYLKDEPAPEWMRSGVKAIDKGKNYGL